MELNLPFREVWAVDFEFVQGPGERPAPVCMVATELRSGATHRLWQDELDRRCPFSTGPESLFVAYAASAEVSCFLELEWPVPARILDLYVEFRAVRNGAGGGGRSGLLAALSHYGIPAITSAEKDAGRALVMRGGPWNAEERQATLDYCATDVDALGPLLQRMLPELTRTTKRLGQALLRGRCMAAVARMERTGIPIDAELLGRFRASWGDIKLRLIESVDADFGLYDGASFKVDRFRRWLAERGIAWPTTASGLPCLDQDTFRDLAKTHPELAPVKDLRHALSGLRLEELEVGADGRNRTSLMPFGARTGRHTPSNTKFVFGPAVWMRGLIKPAQGRAIAYIDFSAQEVAIAAALSGDGALQAAMESGDPYLSFARTAGLAPEDATKGAYRAVRDVCKTALLGVNYGMGAPALAARIGASQGDAEHLLRALARAYPVFWQWRDDVVNRALLGLPLATVFGWPVRVEAGVRETQLTNFPMQSNGAEMLRLAYAMATESGVEVCAPVHDALLVEGPADAIGDVVATTSGCMAAASRAVLDGLEVGTDASVTSWPSRYSDPRGREMWARIVALVGGEALSANESAGQSVYARCGTS